jgi:ComF family protein
VPLAPGRLRERGYNQAALIAQSLALVTMLPAPQLAALSKVRETRPQVGLSRAARRQNVRGAFACLAPHLVQQRRCLLIDDVMTTGATLEACAEALVQAGADRVMALVVARSDELNR